jgi:diamine N-acetyltransferase
MVRSQLAVLDHETKNSPAAKVSLREITRETVKSILDLGVSKEQERFIASNARSSAEAYFAEEAWFRAIYVDETPVGFVMISDVPEKAEYYLWRFMIDAKYQGRGYGRCALKLVIEHVKTRPNAKALYPKFNTYGRGTNASQRSLLRQSFPSSARSQTHRLHLV